jgi:hypothetical protein
MNWVRKKKKKKKHKQLGGCRRLSSALVEGVKGLGFRVLD